MVGMGWQRLGGTAAIATVLGIAACGGGDGSADSALVASDSLTRDSAAGTTTPSPTTTPSSSAPGSGALTITGGDPEIVQVLAVVDQGQIEDGRLAQRQARNAQVKAFARELVTSHQRALQKDRALAKTLNVQLMTMDSAVSTGTAGRTDTSRTAAGTPGATANLGGPNSVAGQLHTMHMQAMQQVRSLQGAAFDSAFVNAQIMGHQQVLDLLQRAQAQAQNADVQQHLSQATTEVQNHLQRAQQLQQTLMSGGASGDTTSKSKSDTGRRGG